MKKILAIVVAAVMMVSALVVLASCGSKGEGIVGEWETEINFGKMLGAEAEGAEEMFGSLLEGLKDKTIGFTINLKENGKATATVDVDSYVSLMKEMLGDLATEEQLRESIEQQMGEEVDYKFENGELTLGETVFKAELSGDKLTFTDVVSASEEESNQMLSAGVLPLEFTRK